MPTTGTTSQTQSGDDDQHDRRQGLRYNPSSPARRCLSTPAPQQCNEGVCTRTPPPTVRKSCTKFCGKQSSSTRSNTPPNRGTRTARHLERPQSARTPAPRSHYPSRSPSARAGSVACALSLPWAWPLGDRTPLGGVVHATGPQLAFRPLQHGVRRADVVGLLGHGRGRNATRSSVAPVWAL